MDLLEEFVRYDQMWSTFQLPPSTKQIPFVPSEVLADILYDLDNTELKAARYLSRHWAYDPLIINRLFKKVYIIPHETALDEFVSTFSSSLARYAFTEFKFGLARFYMCDEVARQVELRRNAKGLDEDGNMLKDVRYRTNHGEIYADEGRNWFETDQPDLLRRLIDVFQCVPALRKVDIVCDHEFTQVLGKKDPADPKKCDCGNIHSIWSMFYGVAEEVRAINPLCRFLYLHRVQEDISPQISRILELIQNREIVDKVYSGTICQALSVSNVCLNDMSVDLLGDEVNSLRMSMDWSVAINSFFTVGYTDDALSNLKHLRISFSNYMTNTEEQSHARLQLLQRSPKLQTLQVHWNNGVNSCFQASNPEYWRSASDLIDVFSISKTPMFPELRSLHLKSVVCRADELLHLISFHCPTLRVLTFETIAFVQRPPELPGCWVKFLKKLKQSCSPRIELLEIIGGICNSSYRWAYGVNQHWHVSDVRESQGEREGGWLRDRVIQWFHTPEQTDGMCPLNLWELTQEGTVFRGREKDFDKIDDENLIYWSWDDASWDDRSVFAEDDSSDLGGFGLFD